MNEPTRGVKSPFLHCPPPQNILGTGFRGSMKHRKSEEGETEFQNTFGRTLRGVDFHVYSSNKFMDTFVLSFRFCRCLIDEYGNTTKAPTTSNKLFATNAPHALCLRILACLNCNNYLSVLPVKLQDGLCFEYGYSDLEQLFDLNWDQHQVSLEGNLVPQIEKPFQK